MEWHDFSKILYLGLIKILSLVLHCKFIFTNCQKVSHTFTFCYCLFFALQTNSIYAVQLTTKVFHGQYILLREYYFQHSWGPKILWLFLLNCKKLLKLYHSINCNIFCPRQILLGQFRSTGFEICALVAKNLHYSDHHK